MIQISKKFKFTIYYCFILPIFHKIITKHAFDKIIKSVIIKYIILKPPLPSSKNIQKYSPYIGYT